MTNNKNNKRKYEPQDLSTFVDFESEYLKYLDHARVRGHEIIARCPFHKEGNEKNASFTADTRTGLWQCFACSGGKDSEGKDSEGKGNFVTFVAKYFKISTGEAYKEILRSYGKLKD